jgi:hypothetical protein
MSDKSIVLVLSCLPNTTYDITAGKGGFIINDESGRNFSGCLVSSAGDVNGDGLDDLIISAIYSGDQDNRFKPSDNI